MIKRMDTKLMENIGKYRQTQFLD